MKHFKTLLLLLAISPLATATEIYTPYRVIYDVTRNGDPVGKAHYRLSRTHGDCYVYQGWAVPEGIAALLVSATVERSEFCTDGNRIVPRSYRMWEGNPDDMLELDEDVADDGDDDVDDRNYRALFRERGLTATTNALPARKLEPGTVDNSSLHFAIRDAVAMRLQDDDRTAFDVVVYKENKLKRYQFRITGYETIKTSAGTFKTVRAERTDHRKKRLKFWLATDYNLLPVQVTRAKKGNSDYTLSLRKIH